MNTRWAPFSVIPIQSTSELPRYADAPRSIHTLEGIGDRMRVAAFAEIQARDAFLWAADHFEDAPESLRKAWRKLSLEEQNHLNWLLNRMKELGIDPQERPLTNQLWVSLTACTTAREFQLYIANSEERGRLAGIRFHDTLKDKDPITAGIFLKIAQEEVSHVALAQIYFPDAKITPDGSRKTPGSTPA